MLSQSAVITIEERCRVCYTCVRECPAKAIRIRDGQAEVLQERCISCGNCVKVCSQNAKQFISGIEVVEDLLASGKRVAACLAPSFPAEFTNMETEQLVGMVRKLGFEIVAEVGFGADLVAERYQQIMQSTAAKQYIATSCPAVVAYVERYHPDMVDHLAPVVSPMVAEARALKRFYGDDLHIVFIGPCIAKKLEARSSHLENEIDEALTFSELREMFKQRGIMPFAVRPTDFDPPHAGLGALFPISRGMLQAADIDEDLMLGEVVASDGKDNMIESLKEFSEGTMDARLLEVLCCNGCIMGPGLTYDRPLFERRCRVSRYVRRRSAKVNRDEWRQSMDALEGLDLSREYSAKDQRVNVPTGEEIEAILRRLGKETYESELNCGACGYPTCREHATAISLGLAESEMCLPYLIDQLKVTCRELAHSNEELASMQEALLQAEKLASMGQLAAGIAHEVNNPLGIVLLYAHLLEERAAEDEEMREDVGMIVEQADRCKNIVSGLLQFARKNKVTLNEVNLDELIRSSLGAMRLGAQIKLQLECALEDPTVAVDRDQIVQVLTNLVSNSQAAMPQGGTITVRTRPAGGQHVTIEVSDTGCGIPDENLSKIFEPFFTTKQIGKGTGLGLAVIYGIVKMHRGDIAVESNANPERGPTGTTFRVKLPRRAREE